MATWQSESVTANGAIVADPLDDVQNYGSQFDLMESWAHDFSPTYKIPEAQLIVDDPSGDDVVDTAYRNNSPVWLNTQTYVDTAIRFVGDHTTTIVSETPGSGSAAPRRYVMTGFYRTTGQYENWVSEDPTSPSPTGHSLVNISVVAIAKS